VVGHGQKPVLYVSLEVKVWSHAFFEMRCWAERASFLFVSGVIRQETVEIRIYKKNVDFLRQKKLEIDEIVLPIEIRRQSYVPDRFSGIPKASST
jgi:hypothetical protein